MSDTEYGPSGNSTLSFHVIGDILNLVLLYKLLMFFHASQILRFDRANFFSPLLKCNLSLSLSIKARGSEVSLFSEFINVKSIFMSILV